MDRAEQAFEDWEKHQMFPVSIVEQHGFICGYREAQKECQHWERQYLELRDLYHKLLRKRNHGED
jgi:hypothetical protein